MKHSVTEFIPKFIASLELEFELHIKDGLNVVKLKSTF